MWLLSLFSGLPDPGGFRVCLGLMNCWINGWPPALVAVGHGEGKGETLSLSVDPSMVWECRMVLQLWMLGVLAGGMGGAGRRELPPCVVQGAVRGRM